ncbi:MAG: hypothetical protein ABIV21_02515, partial [Pyrinomonadaceae bacterium]
GRAKAEGPIMENIIFYLMPFLKNFSLLCLTVFFILFATAVIKSGVQSFVLTVWLKDGKQRFITGLVFIFLLSVMMAVTDTAPLFLWLGLAVNASPFGLAMGICVALGFISTASNTETRQSVKAKEIIQKSGEISQQASEIIREEKDNTTD